MERFRKFMKNSTLKYNEELAARVRQNLPLEAFQKDGVSTSMGEVECLLQALSLFEAMQTAEANLWDRAECFFYACTEAARHKPDLCPVPDFCLLAFNVLESMGDMEGQEIVCLDIALLPVAILAAARGARVTLTAGEQIENLTTLLTRALPTTTWNVRQQCSTLPDGSLVLGQHPGAILEREGMDVMRGFRGGVLFSYWDFLGVETQSHVRERWLESGLVRGVLQLPRPRRQSAGYYPALIALGRGDGVRLAWYECKGVGAGAWDQDDAMRLLSGAVVDGVSMNMPVADLYIKGVPDLTPRYHLSRVTGTEGGGEMVRLGDVAHIIRCQLPRTRMEDAEVAALQCEPGVHTERQGGVMHDGSFVCREISLADLDQLTGFVMDQGDLVRVAQLNPEGRQGKYLLRQGDIVLAFRGTEPSIGRVGLWEFDGTYPAITGQSLCIIRAFGVDATWLYYWLRRNGTRAGVVAKAVGSRMLTVNLADLRELPLIQPIVEALALTKERHKKVVSLLQYVRFKQLEIFHYTSLLTK